MVKPAEKQRANQEVTEVEAHRGTGERGVWLEPGKLRQSEKPGNWAAKQVTETLEKIRTFPGQ